MLVHGDPVRAEAFGGEARWMQRARSDFSARGADEADIKVGADGWALGWEAHARQLEESMSFDAEGYAIDEAKKRIEGEQLGELPPALQMQARARLRLAVLRPKCAIVPEAPGTKFKQPTISLAVQRRNHKELSRWQAKIRATAVYTVDGTRSRVTSCHVVARAAMRHDGVAVGGGLHEPEGADNYLAELAAQIDAAHAEDEGGRVIIMFDATSPILAMRKFQKACHRKRQGRYAGEWLETLLRLTARLEVVVFMWQRSHTGSAVNEWADVEAEMRAGDAAAGDITAVPRVQSGSRSMALAMPRRSVHEWAMPLAAQVVQHRLMESVTASETHDEYDMPRIVLADGVQRTCDAVAAARSCIGDARLLRGKTRRRLVGPALCPFGCVRQDGSRAQFTWLHAQVFCGQCELIQARQEWVEAIEEAGRSMIPEATGLPHGQTTTVARLAKEGLPRTRGGTGAPERGIDKLTLRSVQRYTSGFIRTTGDTQMDKSRAVRDLIKAAVTMGARVQQKAHELTKAAEDKVREITRQEAIARRAARRWRANVAAGGPARAAALAGTMQAHELVVSRLIMRAQVGCCTTEEAMRIVDELATTGSPTEVTYGSLTQMALADARTETPRTGARMCQAIGRKDTPGTVAWQWRILALARRWRLIARLRIHKRLRATGGEKIESAGTRTELPAQEATRLGMVATGECWRYSVPAPTWETTVHVRTHVAAAAGTCRVAHSLLSVTGLMEQEATAAARWDAGGGWRGEVRRRAEWRRRVTAIRAATAAEELARSAKGMRRYLQQGAGAPVGVSGRPIAAVGARYDFEFEPRKRCRHTASRTTKQRGHRQSEVELGAAADGRGRWRVERVLEVRRPRGSARSQHARELEARLRWVGNDPSTGAPWKDSWVPVRSATVGAGGQQVMARMMTGELEREAVAMEKLKYGTVATGGRTKRPAEAAAEGQTERKMARKWQGALRGQRAAAGMREISTGRWRRKVAGSRQLASGCSSESESDLDEAGMERLRLRALSDVRRRRAATADILVSGRKRPRHSVVYSEGSDSDGAVCDRKAASRGSEAGDDERADSGERSDDDDWSGGEGQPEVYTAQMAGGEQGHDVGCTADEGGGSSGGREDDAVDEAAGWFDSIRRWWRGR